MKGLKVRNVIIGKQFEVSNNYKEFVKIVKEKKIKVHVVKARDKINIENNLFFDIIWPDGTQNVSTNSINNNALVCKLKYKNFSMLFTGDIEEETEKILVNKYKSANILRATVLKVAHHGSKTSSTQEFLNLVKNKFALIGVGKDNNFGHPSSEVIQRLSDLRYKNL